MRVLIVSGIFPPDRGGPASHVPRMAEALAKRGHSVEVVCLSDRVVGDGTSDPVPVHRIRRDQFWPLRIGHTVFVIWRAAWRQDCHLCQWSRSRVGACRSACRPADRSQDRWRLRLGTRRRPKVVLRHDR